MSGANRTIAPASWSAALRTVQRAGYCIPAGLAASFAGGMTMAALIVLGMIFIGPFPGLLTFLGCLIVLPWVLGLAGLFFGGPGAIVAAALLTPLLRRKRFAAWSYSVATGVLSAMPATALSLRVWHALGIPRMGTNWPDSWHSAWTTALWLAPSGAAGGAAAWWILSLRPKSLVAALNASVE